MRKIFRKIIILTIFCLMLLASHKAVQAASASITASKTSVIVGESVTIKVAIKAASWNLHVKGSTSEDIVGNTDDAKNITKTQTINFKAEKKGKYTIKLLGDVTDGTTDITNDVSGSVTINVKEKATTSNKPTNNLTDNSNNRHDSKPSNNNTTSNNISNNNNTTSNNNATNDNNTTRNDDTTSNNEVIATLKNLGITPNDFSGFRSTKTSYSVKVPNSVSKINIYASAKSNKATVSGTGTKNLKEGNNTFSVSVTAEDKKTTKTYTLNITREKKTEEANDATLKNFGMKPQDFSGFKAEKTNYLVEVPNDVEKINIYATAKNSKATISGTGEKKLKEGNNTFSVSVTAEDKKTTKTYTLVVVRKRTEEKEKPVEVPNAQKADGLTNIEVAGYTISPRFNNDIYEYNLDIGDETELDIKTEVSNNNYEVEIVGNEKFNAGENVITILVRNTKNDKVTTYQLIANVPEKEIDVSGANSAIADAQKDVNKQQWIIKGTIIAIILLIIIFIIYRHRLNKDEEYEEEEEDDDDERKAKDRINLDEEEIFKRANNNFSTEIIEDDSNINNEEKEAPFDFRDTTLPKEDHELDDFENLDNLEEILRKRKEKNI